MVRHAEDFTTWACGSSIKARVHLFVLGAILLFAGKKMNLPFRLTRWGTLVCVHFSAGRAGRKMNGHQSPQFEIPCDLSRPLPIK